MSVESDDVIDIYQVPLKDRGVEGSEESRDITGGLIIIAGVQLSLGGFLNNESGNVLL